jgi:hypothetical protein
MWGLLKWGKKNNEDFLKKSDITPLYKTINSKNRNMVLKMVEERYMMGEHQYGVFDPHQDKRDLYQENIEELADCINYQIFQIQKILAMKEKYSSMNRSCNLQCK